jgi:ABC-type multidrug transport system ATPase subunit
MGPSGAGKSTLLNLLTLVPSKAEIHGVVRLNGHPLTDTLFKRHCAYVPQEDHLWPFLTCRETIEYAVDFYLNLPPADRKERVDSLLVDLGLESCQKTRCGNQFIQGLSGGQKRRLSLALALVKHPAVLFLDELTSGLDSHAAGEIMAVVRRVARAGRIVVVCTIHQPSARVFNAFDSVMLLSGGRVAYSGPVAAACDYFAAVCARAPPKDLTAAEFLLESVNGDFGGAEKQAQVARLLSAWADRAAALAPPPAPTGVLPDDAGPASPLAKQARGREGERGRASGRGRGRGRGREGERESERARAV